MLGRLVWLSLFLGLASVAPAQTLKLGDKAPPLETSGWLLNGPIRTIEDGTVYVIELCATWSPTLQQSIPFLNSVHERYRDRGVVIAGVCVRESSRAAPQVFFARPPASLPPVVYAIGTDNVPDPPQGTPDDRVWAVERGRMSTEWLEASGRNTLPTAYIVDRAGRLAWIGNTLYPRGELEAALEAVLAGSLTPEASRALGEQMKAREQREKEAEARFQRARTDRKPREAIAAIDELLAIDAAHWLPTVAAKKVHILLSEIGDAKTASEFAASALEGGLKDAVQPLNDIAWILLTAPTARGVGERDVKLALRLAQRADELVGHQRPDVIDTLARAYYANGDLDNAVCLQSEAIEIQRKVVEASTAKDGPVRFQQDLEKTLKNYQDAKARGGR